jgi:hypothetical protein
MFLGGCSNLNVKVVKTRTPNRWFKVTHKYLTGHTLRSIPLDFTKTVPFTCTYPKGELGETREPETFLHRVVTGALREC